MNSDLAEREPQPGERVAGHARQDEVRERHEAGHDHAVQEQLGDARVEGQEARLPALQRERVGDDRQAQRVAVVLNDVITCHANGISIRNA